jgi:predicted membrane chloride channel (bestrophin family)
MQEDEANTRPRDWTQRYAFTPLPSFGPQQWVAHREPGRYLRHALAFPASRLAHNLALPVAYSVAAVALLAAYDAEAARLGWPRMAHSDGLGPLGLSSSALSLLLVFRTNASYKRYDESRHTWGVVVNTSRNLVRQAHLFFPPDAASEKAALRRWVVALAHCTRLHMRAPLEQAPAELAAARPPLQPAEADAVAASMHRPNFCLQALGKLISLNVADRYVAMKLDECLTRARARKRGCTLVC